MNEPRIKLVDTLPVNAARIRHRGTDVVELLPQPFPEAVRNVQYVLGPGWTEPEVEELVRTHCPGLPGTGGQS
ncbi:hypothetical protein ACGFZU_34810 [Streptomyces tendae]|uniref:hypothetical protein n=1 Tax=Streptomyces tendae TaxID=1932 RepID=UPI0037201FEC